ncbi:hypothetical protein [Chromobacterium sphagni]|uniref:hypothetical protein n=1 Tax=Chromobacterium sphagni TaxID=1903179 RepID=UPI0011133E4A|nr:hypothetical protein [Chromobacterium sphagni]
MTQHQIFLIGGADDETANFIEDEANGLFRLVCEYRGKTISSEAHDYFEALCTIRLELENEGLIPFCYGASINVYPSAMARDMGKGKVAYKMEMGKPATRENLVRIFEEGADVIPSPVTLQKEFFKDWLASIRG